MYGNQRIFKSRQPFENSCLRSLTGKTGRSVLIHNRRPETASSLNLFGAFIMHMQKLMCPSVQNASVIEVINHGIFLAALDGSRIVGLVHALQAFLFIHLVAEGLTCAGNAAVRAGHDFYKVEMLLAALDFFNQVIRVAQSAHHADAHFSSVQLHFGSLDAFHAADAGKLDVPQGLGILFLNQTAQRRFCYASGHAENDARSGRDGEGHVGSLRINFVKGNAAFPDHADQLFGGDDVVHVRNAVPDKFFPAGFHLFRHAGHDGDGNGLAVLFLTVGKERLPRMTYSDMLVRIDWNDRISAEENGRRTAELVARLGDRIEQSTIMAGVQQFILSHTDQTGIAEAVVYLKCRDAADVEPVQRAIRDDLAAHAPGALCSFGVSGNVFDMIFAEREALLTARLRATSGRSPDPEALQALIGRIREALPGQTISDAPMQEDLLYVARPERMALYGIGYAQLVAALRNALNENTLFTIASGDETLPVVLGSNQRDLERLLAETFITTPEAEIPVRTLLRQT